MRITNAYLASRGFANEDQTWISKVLPDRISRLRRVRNRAEHESNDSWTREIIGNFIDEFIGIGQPGVLPRLGELFFSTTA